MTSLPKIFFDAKGMDLEQLEQAGTIAAVAQKTCNWVIGDVARYAEARWPDKWQQVFPEWISPGLVDRCKGVAKAYPMEGDRNEGATWSQHMQVANDPDRVEIVSWMVLEGLTSDEARECLAEKRKQAKSKRWLLAIDVNYYVHRFWHSGAGVATASGVSGWIQRTVERLKAKGLTDVACCFDSRVNHRKELTKDWEDKYKDRPPKDPELIHQLHMTGDLLQKQGYSCCAVENYEADDVMASFGVQFDGQVTLLSQDKDLRQCLSSKCNILLDVQWSDNELTGQAEPTYEWLSAAQHTEATGLTPSEFLQAQALMGDNVDGVRGVEGIGKKGAKDLIQKHGTAAAVIEACKADAFPYITPKKRQALLDFEDKLETTLALVTLRTDLPLQTSTRLM